MYTGSFASTTSQSSLRSLTPLEPHEWVANTPECQLCDRRFTFFGARPHHCRTCGRCVCEVCSPNKIQLDGLMQRVCKACIENELPGEREPLTNGTAGERLHLANKINEMQNFQQLQNDKIGRLNEQLLIKNREIESLKEQVQNSSETSVKPASGGDTRNPFDDQAKALEGGDKGGNPFGHDEPTNVGNPFDKAELPPSAENPFAVDCNMQRVITLEDELAEAREQISRYNAEMAELRCRLQDKERQSNGVETYTLAEPSEKIEEVIAEDFGLGVAQIESLNKSKQVPPRPPLVRSMTNGASVLPHVDDTEVEDSQFGIAEEQLKEVATRSFLMESVHEEVLHVQVDDVAMRLQRLLTRVADHVECEVPVLDGQDAASACQEAMNSLETAVDQLLRNSWEGRDGSVGSVSSAIAVEATREISKSTVEDDSKNACNVCDAKLGKRHFNPKHECTYCHKFVCGKCSPSTIKDNEFQDLQRICSNCVKQVFGGPGKARH